MQILSKTTIFLLSLLPLVALSAPPELTKPFTAKYSVLVDGFKVGELSRALTRPNERLYRLESHLKTTGLVAVFKRHEAVERSTWSMQGENPVPIEYYFKHTGRDNSLETVNFDWDRLIATTLRKGETARVEISPGVLEKQLYQLVIRRDLAKGEKVLSYDIAERGEIRNYRFRVVGRETLNTALGKLETVKVQRIHESNKRHTYFWCAPKLDYMLVRIEQNDDGHTYSSVIESFKN